MAKARKWAEFPDAEYGIWRGMVRRCEDPRHPSFARYGGRGIDVCERWRKDFKTFFSDMGPRPSPEHSLDRHDGDGDYTPENCRWATRSVQQRNREMILRANGASRVGHGWCARICINGRGVSLGYFETKAEASRVYRQAAVQVLIITELLSAALGPLMRNGTFVDRGSTASSARRGKHTMEFAPPAPQEKTAALHCAPENGHD